MQTGKHAGKARGRHDGHHGCVALGQLIDARSHVGFTSRFHRLQARNGIEKIVPGDGEFVGVVLHEILFHDAPQNASGAQDIAESIGTNVHGCMGFIVQIQRLNGAGIADSPAMRHFQIGTRNPSLAPRAKQFQEALLRWIKRFKIRVTAGVGDVALPRAKDAFRAGRSRGRRRGAAEWRRGIRNGGAFGERCQSDEVLGRDAQSDAIRIVGIQGRLHAGGIGDKSRDAAKHVDVAVAEVQHRRKRHAPHAASLDLAVLVRFSGGLKNPHNSPHSHTEGYMKIDIGTEGKILGTKRVSPNGQVSGLSEFAGEEVLIIYPGPREPRIKMEAKDYLHEVEKAVHQQMKSAFGQYKGLKTKYKDEAEATRAFIHDKSPKTFQGLVETVDGWASAQIKKAESKVAKKLGDKE